MNEVIPSPVRAPLRAGGSVSAIVPQSIEDAFRLAEAFLVAGLVPDSYKGKDNRETASRVLIGILKGAECGLPPVTALSNIYIVNNKPAVYGDGALAIIQAHPQFAGCKEWLTGKPDQDDYTAHCVITRKLQSGELVVTERTFTWGDAKRASLTRRGPWVSYAQRMLQMRARAWALRDSFADALSGLSIAEEIQDLPVKSAEVATAFLDPPPEALPAPEQELITDAAVTDQVVIDQSIDDKALLAAIKKDFLKAGDDPEKQKNVLAAAEAVELSEPYATELKTILEAKKQKHGKSS